MPANHNEVPPGYYMLFLVNGQGVPSVASFVRFPAPYEDTSPPTAPTGLTASGGIGTASLKWEAATDDTAIARYNVHRSSAPNFTPTVANRVGQTSSTSFSEAGLATGTWYYKVTAEDQAGNVGPPSNEASATVTADTTPPEPPTGLQGTPAANSAALKWNAAVDNVGVTGYRIFRNGSSVGTVSGTSFNDTGLTSATGYTYAVAALRRGRQRKRAIRADHGHDHRSGELRARQNRDHPPELGGLDHRRPRADDEWDQ